MVLDLMEQHRYRTLLERIRFSDNTVSCVFVSLSILSQVFRFAPLVLD